MKLLEVIEKVIPYESVVALSLQNTVNKFSLSCKEDATIKEAKRVSVMRGEGKHLFRQCSN